MKGIGKLLIFISFLVIILRAAPAVSADIVFPECRWDELKFSCDCPHAANMCATNLCPACLQYENDPRYYYLWQDLYCRKATLLELLAKFKYSFFIPFFTVMVLGSAVFFIRGFKNRKEMAAVILANGISFLFGAYLLGSVSQLINKIFFSLRIPDISFALFGMNVPRMVSLFVMAALVSVFEAIILIYGAKFQDRRKVYITAVIAGFVSLILGLGTLNAIYPKFLQPRLF